MVDILGIRKKDSYVGTSSLLIRSPCKKQCNKKCFDFDIPSHFLLLFVWSMPNCVLHVCLLSTQDMVGKTIQWCCQVLQTLLDLLSFTPFPPSLSLPWIQTCLYYILGSQNICIFRTSPSVMFSPFAMFISGIRYLCNEIPLCYWLWHKILSSINQSQPS